MNIIISDSQNILDKFQLKFDGIRKKMLKIKLDSTFVYYLIKELFISEYYQEKFVNYQCVVKFLIILLPTTVDLIDYKWNQRVYTMVRERAELDHALSWLSTLGGAFSALGDVGVDYAVIAGRISCGQMQLALRLQDPTITARCRLYMALSLIQRRRFRMARLIILDVYQQNNLATICDKRLSNMCKGIWTKLLYEKSNK